MTSLYRVLEQIDEATLSAGLDQIDFSSIVEYAGNEPDPKAIGAIRAGLNIDPAFWEYFLRICNQSANLSVLLGVRKEVIARWPSLIREHLDHVRRLDSSDALQKRATLIPTGMK